jgi:hypothetical protein
LPAALTRAISPIFANFAHPHDGAPAFPENRTGTVLLCTIGAPLRLLKVHQFDCVVYMHKSKRRTLTLNVLIWFYVQLKYC